MISKSKAIPITFLLIFLIWIIEGPQLISQFKRDGELPLNKTQYVDYSYNGAVTYALEAITFNPADYREVISLTGWSFLKLEKNITQRKINVLFLSEKRSYKVETNISQKHEIIEVYKPGNSSGINDEIGFSTMFSAITIKNGEYKIAIAVRENDVEKVEYIGKILKKEAGRVNIIDDHETGRSDFSESTDSLSNLPGAYGSVDALSDIGGGNAYIYGWAFGELKQQVKNRDAYAFLASENLNYKASLQSINRYGLIEAIDKSIPVNTVLNPAYKGILGFENVKDGKYKLLLLVIEDDTSYLQNSGIVVNKQGETISITKE